MDRQTDRQTNTGVCGFFLSVKFATSLLVSLAGDNFQTETKLNIPRRKVMVLGDKSLATASKN